MKAVTSQLVLTVLIALLPGAANSQDPVGQSEPLPEGLIERIDYGEHPELVTQAMRYAHLNGMLVNNRPGNCMDMSGVESADRIFSRQHPCIQIEGVDPVLAAQLGQEFQEALGDISHFREAFCSEANRPRVASFGPQEFDDYFRAGVEEQDRRNVEFFESRGVELLGETAFGILLEQTRNITFGSGSRMNYAVLLESTATTVEVLLGGICDGIPGLR